MAKRESIYDYVTDELREIFNDVCLTVCYNYARSVKDKFN